LAIHAIPKLHDAIDPHSFVVEQDEWKIGIFTDIGSICENVNQSMSTCQVLFLETNYDEQMLEEGPYPHHLKKRISSNEGHLSNTQAVTWLKNQPIDSLKHILPAHLSAENNHPEKVITLLQEQLPHLQFTLAGRHSPTPLFSIKDLSIKKAAPAEPMQLGLF
jgi:phosphoribosyl 1,2-cyclic phosphodiesterase